MIDLIIGNGEVGQALAEVLRERKRVGVHDPPKGLHWYPAQAEANGGVDWMHVAIPYSKTFLDGIIHYVLQFRPKRVVIHSTIPVGTTRRLASRFALGASIGANVRFYYSPIRGRHPHLKQYMREFPKWFAGPDEDQAAADALETYFATSAMQTRQAPNYEFLELAKLWETTTQGYLLSMWHEIERTVGKIPGEYAQNIEAMRNWLYEKRKVYDGDVGFVPILSNIPGPIGGHCIVSNYDLLKPLATPEFYEWLKESNEMRKVGLK